MLNWKVLDKCKWMSWCLSYSLISAIWVCKCQHFILVLCFYILVVSYYYLPPNINVTSSIEMLILDGSVSEFLKELHRKYISLVCAWLISILYMVLYSLIMRDVMMSTKYNYKPPSFYIITTIWCNLLFKFSRQIKGCR